MKFILDENVSSLTDDPLRSLGHTLLRLPLGTKDIELMKISKRENAVIITHDRDFISLPFSESEGIILLRIRPAWAKDVIHALKRFLEKITASELKGKLVLLEPEGFHIKF